MVTDATEEDEVCQLMIWIGLPAMPGRVKGWLVAHQPASKYSTQLPPPPVVPQSQTQFQTTATTLLIIFLQTGKYSITKPSLSPPCFVHSAHVFVRHILIQNLLVAVQCLDMKCSAPLSECKIWFVPTGIEPSNFLSMPCLSSQHAA